MQLYLPRFCMSQIFSRFIKPVPPKNVNQKKRALQLAIKEKQQQLEQSGLLDENLKQERFTHTTNYNFETYLKYTKLVKAEKEKEIQVIQPKQKRVAIYDRPKFDLSLNDYYVWTTFHDPYYKPDEYSEIVVCKIYLSPKGLIHAFGMGMDPWRNKLATKEFDFEDSNLDKFCLYDAKQTTKFWGPNKSEQFYNKQQYLKPIYRKKRWPTYDEFWNQEEKAPFRVNCTRYGDFRKFKEWIQQEIERCSKLPSFEERVLKKYGQPEFYDDYSKNYQCKTEPAVYKYTREYFLEKGQKLDQSNVLNIPLQPPEHLGEEYRVPNK
ncbi:unnamed protein product [Paramecium primaurelia]|uniref:Uncharacterized protein n=1 Tax=Paramecium primaurelia TaxID=5886 RepID=A0A8S1LSH5_PARPR|nr:unnamed protein product [Paramecium primaurelia]